MTENRDRSVQNGPIDIGLGHDIMAEVTDNEVISAEVSDFSESNLSTSAGSQQKCVSKDSHVICKDDLKKTKDCLYSLEDALDKLEAQNSE